MKRQLTIAITAILMFLLSVGQLPVLAAAGEKDRANAKRHTPAKSVKRLRQEVGAKPKRPDGESMTLLSDGRSLLLGGESSNGSLASAEIKDARTGAITRLARGMGQNRAWHTATVLPDGKVAIIGGITDKGALAHTVEIFDPETLTFSRAPGQVGRAYHTATLLTDGRVFIAGGSDGKGGLVKKVEFWSEAKTNSISKASLQDARAKATASIQADGSVLLSAGTDESGATISSAEIYSPDSDSLIWVPAKPVDPETGAPRVTFSAPADGTVGVDTTVRIAVRFSRPLQPETINRETVALAGPAGSVPTKVVAAEKGRLAFITPLALLKPDSDYHLSIDGAIDADNQKLAFSSISFKTKSETTAQEEPTGPQIIDNDSWIPGAENFKSNWKSGRAETETEKLPALQAPAGETALAGRVRGLSGGSLPNVTLQIGDRMAVTDSTGRFLLSSLPAGRQQLTIQGHTAGKPGKRYGTFDVLVDVTAGKTTALPYTIWLPVLDDQNAVSLPVPTNREIGVTTPRVPGMEIRIPADAVMRMPPGAHHSHGLKRQELTSMSITPIPVDRTPFPLPPGVNDGLVFTLQLHGARVEGPKGEKRPGLRIVFPNYQNLPAGARVEFWNYDPAAAGWYMYGRGTVTADRRQVIPDPGVELQSMHCLSVLHWSSAPGTWPTAGGPNAADPVDLSTGLFVHTKTDLVLPDVIPIELSRTYRQNDSIGRSFGVGATTPYDMFILGDNSTYNDLILPDGGRIHFTRAGTEMVFVCNDSPTRFYKATLRLLGQSSYKWEIKLVDGTSYEFAILSLFGNWYSALSLIKDRFGNQMTITRDDHFRPLRITSPHGRWIEFTYTGASPSILSATDNIGRVVSYTYDGSGRLWKVTDVKGGITEYSYDVNHRMLTIKDPRNIVYLTNEYDPSSGRVTKQTLANTGEFIFDYTVDGNGKVTQTDVTDPRDYLRRTTFNADGYCLTDTFAVGTPIQQTCTYERQTGTNFVVNVSDALNRNTAMTYDAQGNITSITRLAGTPHPIVTTMTYEPLYSQVETITDPLTHTISFAYDSNGTLTGITDPLNNETTVVFNSDGQLHTATDPLELTIQLGYDAGDLVAVTDQLNNTVSRYVDAAGRVTQVTSPLGEVARAEFDSANQMTRMIDPLQGVTAYESDPNGNVLSVTDARTGITTYTYNNMDQVETRRDPLLQDEHYLYDLNGNLEQVTDRKNQITNFTYDALNRLTQITYSDTSTTTYTYDLGNRLTQVNDSLSGIITYDYDDLDRLTGETTPQGSVTYAYDDAGRRTSMTVAGQPTVNYTYDNANQLTQITQGSSTVTISYDDSGRRTSLTLPNGIVTEYGYDLGSQLTSLTYKQGGNVIGNLIYEYDKNGRRTLMAGSFARSITPQALSSATYNAANQQLSFGGQTLTYDLNGNLTSDGSNTYTWDARNQLASISGPNVNANFQYDAGGRRVSKTINGTATSFLYDGANIGQEQSAQTGNANLLNGGIDEIFLRTDATGAFSPLTDALGSSLSLTDASGTAQTSYTYGAFGQSGTTGSISNNANHYTSRENDGTGLQYNRARYYSPTLQRFISEDPLGFGGGDINLYGYVGNDPTNLTDPSGEHPVLVAVGVVALILLYPKFVNAPGPQDPIFDNDPANEMVGDLPFMVGGGIVIGKAAGMIGRGCGRIVPKRTPITNPSRLLPQRAGPVADISPSEVIGRTPAQIDARARQLGLKPSGPDPARGRGAYIDPKTGVQRILSHPNGRSPHGHVNNPAGQRIGPNGSVVRPNSPAAHLPIDPR